jgi:MFS family permease
MAAGRSGLDWLNFSLASVQSGFGAFVPAYLADLSWTQAEIGAALSADTIAAMLSQVPAGLLVDAVRRRHVLIRVSVLTLAAAALLLAVFPTAPAIVVALVLHSAVSAVLGPGIAAISLLRSGQCGLGERMGRNARFASLGNLAGAAVMGVLGVLSQRAVFLLTAAMTVPTLIALRATSAGQDRLHEDAAGCLPAHRTEQASPLALLRDRRLLVFVASVLLFQLSNAAIVPIVVSSHATLAVPSTLTIAGFIVVPQLVVAGSSLVVGRAAENFGRRPVLLLGFAALSLRAALFASLSDPIALLMVQGLDGLEAAVIGVMLPIVAADFTRNTGRYNLCLGLFGLAASIGAAASTAMAGVVGDRWGGQTALGVLACIGVLATILVLLGLPETREPQKHGPQQLSAGKSNA